VILDTGSMMLQVPFNNCTTCNFNSQGVSKYDPKASTTFNSTKRPFFERYSNWNSQGYLVEDIVSFENVSVPFEFMGI
jgi:hypothetical protein